MQFDCVGLCLRQQYNGWGLATVEILGAINIPYYIILGEFCIAILLALLAKQVSQSTWTTALWKRVACGVGIFVCYAIAYGLTDVLIPHP